MTTIDARDFYIGARFDRDSFVQAFVDTFECIADPTNTLIIHRWNGAFYERADTRDRSAWGHAYAAMDGAVERIDRVHGPLATVKTIHAELVHRGRVQQGTAFSGVVDGRPVAVFRNGCVDLTTGILSPPSPDAFISGTWNTEYDADLPTPRYDQWIIERGLAEQRPLLESVIGTGFDATYRHPRVLVFSGTWNAGKSVLLRLLSSLSTENFGATRTFNWYGNLSDGGRRKFDHETIEMTRVCLNHSTPVIKALHGQKASRRVRKTVAEYPSNALHIAETLGDGWGVDAEEHRRWEANAPRDLFDIVKFTERVPIPDERAWWAQELPLLQSELPGIVARFIRARVSDPSLWTHDTASVGASS